MQHIDAMRHPHCVRIDDHRFLKRSFIDEIPKLFQKLVEFFTMVSYQIRSVFLIIYSIYVIFCTIWFVNSCLFLKNIVNVA